MDVGTIIEYVRNLTKKEKKINLPFHVDERDVAAVVAFVEYILSSSHTKVRDSNSDFRQMYATFFSLQCILLFYLSTNQNDSFSLSLKTKKISITNKNTIRSIIHTVGKGV